MRRREFVWIGIAAVLAFCWMSREDLRAAEVSGRIASDNYEQIAKHYASIIVACANGNSFSLDDLLVFCDPHSVRVGR